MISAPSPWGLPGADVLLYVFITLDCSVLTDRSVAFCNSPQRRYHDQKTPVLVNLAAVVRGSSFISPVVVLVSKEHFCHSRVIKHFASTAPVSLSCRDIPRHKTRGLNMTIIFSLGFLPASYPRTIPMALRTASGKVRREALRVPLTPWPSW